MTGFKSSKISRTVSLTTGFQLIHQTNAHRAFTLNMIRLTNVTAAAVTVQVCYAPTGQAASAANAVLWDFSIPANDFIEFGEGDIVRDASIQALASANDAVNIRISGTEESSI
jgi:hypothetical protein